MASTNKPPIIKTVLHNGKQYIPVVDGSKVHFHFQTWRLEPERVLIDDSREIGKKEPMVLVIGHKFKLDVWETLTKMMSVGEVSKFVVEKELVCSYPIVSKTLRDLGKSNPKPSHMCAMSLHRDGIGYPDLDSLMSNPTSLEFIIELLRVEKPHEYEKELWQLNKEEQMNLIPELKEKGNQLYAQQKYKEAEKQYFQALTIVEQFIIKEREKDEDWVKLIKIKLPILLNYAQCKLLEGDYYQVIEHCNTVLKHDEDNLKALFRRGKAHIGAWNPDLAEKDFIKLKSLDASMTSAVDKELAHIEQLRKNRESQDKVAYKNLFNQNSGKENS